MDDEEQARLRDIRLTTILHELLSHIAISRRRAGIEPGRPIVLGFATEIRDGDLRSTIDTFREEIRRLENVKAMEWRDDAWRGGFVLDGEELYISVAAAE